VTAIGYALSSEEHGPRDLVAPRRELPLQVRDEDPEVGVLGSRVHLGDEQDLHTRRES